GSYRWDGAGGVAMFPRARELDERARPADARGGGAARSSVRTWREFLFLHQRGRGQLQTFSSACSKSAIRSSGSSIPIETRTRLSVMPRAALRSGGTDRWVIAAGWLARVSVPPRLTASLAIFIESRKRNASASPPRTNSEKVLPGPVQWRR